MSERWLQTARSNPPENLNDILKGPVVWARSDTLSFRSHALARGHHVEQGTPVLPEQDLRRRTDGLEAGRARIGPAMNQPPRLRPPRRPQTLPLLPAAAPPSIRPTPSMFNPLYLQEDAFCIPASVSHPLSPSLHPLGTSS